MGRTWALPPWDGAWMTARNTLLPADVILPSLVVLGQTVRSLLKEMCLENLTPPRPAFQWTDTNQATYDFLLETMDLSRTIFEINKRFQSKITKFSHPHIFNATAEGVPPGIGYRRWGQKKDIFSHLDTIINVTDGRTDGHRLTASTALTHRNAQ